jgi:outer membrane autotransporter protein
MLSLLKKRQKQALKFVKLSVAAISFISFTTTTDARSFSKIVSFGDSLSDNENSLAVTQGQSITVPPQLPQYPYFYWDGRFSDGPLWHENLDFLLGITPTVVSDISDCFAYSVATTRAGFDPDTYIKPGVLTQLNFYAAGSVNKALFNQELSQLKTTNKARVNQGLNPLTVDDLYKTYITDRITTTQYADPKALHSVWAGPNDYRDLAIALDLSKPAKAVAKQKQIFGRVIDTSEVPQFVQQYVTETVQNLTTAITNLANAGARYFLVGNVPTNIDGTSESALLTITGHNKRLESQLRYLALKNPHLTIIPMDAYTLGQEIAKNPASFGLTNVTENYLSTVDNNQAENGTLVIDSTGFLFWDEFGHLTAHANKILGNFVYEVIQGPEAVMPLRQDAFQTMMTQDRLVQNRLDMLRGDDFTQTSASAQFHQAFSSLSPQKESFYFTMADMRKVNQNPMNRLYAMGHEGTSAQDPFSVYVVGDISFGKWKGQQDRTVGSKQTVGTLTVGMDYAFHPNFKAGASFHYLNGNSKMKDNRGKTEMDGYATSLYGRAQFQDFFMDVVGTHGWQHYKLKRNIRLFNRVAKSRPEGKNWSGIFNTGYNLKWNDLKVTPMAGLRYGDYRINDFTEHGAGVFNMFVNRQKAKSLIGNAGGEVGYTFKVSDIKLTPKVRGFYEHNFKKDKGFLVTEMVSMRVPVRTAVPTRNQNYGRLGGGLEAKFNESTSASVDYEAIVGLRRYQNHTVFGKVKFTF